ncbi:MAG TPA: LLM class flavin-dependent oxidoreductase [Candidatus Binatia bacterium]|jgi:probable F420-dependent oxidoreductase
MAGVEFGLLLHTRHWIRTERLPADLEEFWHTAENAEKAGFDHLWVGDSPRIARMDRAHADCLTVMAALAAKTRKIKIGTVPLIAGLRNPVLLAHSLATLDVISSGRIIVGVSAGPQYKFAAQEFEACGVPFEQRAGRLDEAIQLMRRLWAEESVCFNGKYLRLEEIGIQPRPLSKSIPIWCAAGDNENALKRVARLGDGWFTVAPTPEIFAARRLRIERFARQLGQVRNLPSMLFATFHLHRKKGKAEEEGWNLAKSYYRQPRGQLKHLSPFFGTPEQCADKLQQYLAAGLTGVVARFVAPDIEVQSRLLLNEVKPRLKRV